MSGYLPITKAAYEKTKAAGFYEKNPGIEVALLELTNKPPTENSRGLRFGNFVQIRDVWAEEIEAALSGKKTAKAALDDAVERGNEILRQFERTAASERDASIPRQGDGVLPDRPWSSAGSLLPDAILPGRRKWRARRPWRGAPSSRASSCPISCSRRNSSSRSFSSFGRPRRRCGDPSW